MEGLTDLQRGKVRYQSSAGLFFDRGALEQFLTQATAAAQQERLCLGLQ
jgi:hypothetical protein